MDNKERYNNEREKRWSMAKQKEPEAIAVICHILECLSNYKIENMRYDEIWFKKFDPNLPENDWVKGASDYVIKIDNDKYVYAEIKLKSVKFKKTKNGGITQKGSVVAKYGCESFYLDIEPVYKNMCAFVEKTKIKSQSFIIFFINEDLSEIHVISLEEIQNMVKNGFKGQELCIFTEGYGAINYLIPEQATELLNLDYIEQHSTSKLVTILPTNKEYYRKQDRLPLIDASRKERGFYQKLKGTSDKIYYYAGTMFYHCRRNCRYIMNKSNDKVQEITYEDIRKKRLIPCNECCQK